ncbi:MAG: helix-turn-helix transcriptional regulator [Betaproteobacteria bacterium]
MATSIHSSRHQLLRKLLIEQRSKAGLTQQAVADLLDRPQSFVSKYESGERDLSVIDLVEIAEAVGFDAGTLVRKVAG